MNENLIPLGLVEDNEIELDTAALVLASLDHPEVDLTPYDDLLDGIADDLGAIGADLTEAAAQADALTEVLAGAYGFNGDTEDYDDPANTDLIRVLDRRRGLPVSLSILYVAAARRLGWTANVLDVPGHVLVLIGGEASPVMLDPFRDGARVDREQLAALIAAYGAGPAAAVTHVAAMPNRAVLVRLLLNQATRAERAGKGRRALELYARMTVIAPNHGHAWWERARLELIDGDVPAARISLSAMLEITRDPTVRATVSAALATIG